MVGRAVGGDVDDAVVLHVVVKDTRGDSGGSVVLNTGGMVVIYLRPY